MLDPRIGLDLAVLWRRQWAGPAELERLATRRLRRMAVHAAATVPFYRERFHTAGLNPGRLTLAELAGLPILTRAELEATPLARRLSSAIPQARMETTRTSGSTGRPLTIYRDGASRRLRKAQFWRAILAAGYRPGQPLLLLTQAPASPSPSWLRWHHAGRDATPEAHLASWRGLRPEAVYGMLTPLRRLARAILDGSATGQRSRLVFATGETLDGSTRGLLEAAFGGQVFSIYGSAETGTVGFECPAHRGLHFAQDLIVPELVPVAQTGSARLVLTSLINRAMPMFRYAIGDLASGERHEPCPCGRGFMRVERIEGRAVDCLKRLDRALVPPYPIEAAIENVAGVTRFRVVQEEDGAVRVELESRADPEIAAAIPVVLRPLLGPGLPITVGFEADLDPPPGRKFRLVECRVGA